ncbi:MAG: hypothetical protein ONB25_12580 [candidate division KSB1 bacterium]|nr:hypothetical protein [candidate division KSB1 bacterium]
MEVACRRFDAVLFGGQHHVMVVEPWASDVAGHIVVVPGAEFPGGAFKSNVGT